MRKTVGYFEGTDSTLLTALVIEGYDTIPVSNGRDNHGQHVRLINDQNRYDILIAYVHKIFAPEEPQPGDATYQDVFHLCRTYSIPLLLEVPEPLQVAARELLGDPPDIVRFVDPSDMLMVANKLLKGELP
ncbi:MAG: hypothetical protein QNJ88_11825 [Acidimicrobiia bacterium]|nr:hypothetical protein [Acidimicrobiia bacterium]